MRLADRETALRWALLLPIPFVPSLLWIADRGNAATTITIAWLAVTALCMTAAPLAGLGRREAGALAGLAEGAAVLAGSVWLYLAIVSLCSAGAARGLIAIGCGVVPYLAFAVPALRSDETMTRLVGLPLAIVTGFALSTIALGILAGGPHSCPT
jgi:hypothetical protein